MALAIVRAAGAFPLFMEAAHHDHIVGLTSHLPYLLSAQLMAQASELAEAETRTWQTSASGFRDMARLSGSGPAMMADILLSNRDVIVEHLRRYQLGLDRALSLLENGDESALLAWLENVRIAHSAYRISKERDRS